MFFICRLNVFFFALTSLFFTVICLLSFRAAFIPLFSVRVVQVSILATQVRIRLRIARNAGHRLELLFTIAQ